MIVVAGFNAAIDKRIDVDALSAGRVHRATAVAAAPGGKGLHVAQALAVLGSEVHLVGLVDARHRDLFETVLRDCGVTFHGIAAPVLRTCLAIRERDGRITEVLEPGPRIDAETIAALNQTFHALAARADLAVLSGSLPTGCAEDTYATLVRNTQARGVRCLVDASGAVLRATLAAQPFLVKPNRDEATALCGIDITAIEQAVAALRGLRAAGVEMPLLSLGAQGAVMAAGDNCLQAVAPHIDAVNPVGSGDCMLAGIAHALARGDDPVQALALGVACGSANALQEDTGRIAAATVVDLLARVQINTLSSSIPSNTRRQDWRRSATS